MQATLLDFGCIIEPYRIVYPKQYLWRNKVESIQKKLSDFGIGIKTRSL